MKVDQLSLRPGEHFSTRITGLHLGQKNLGAFVWLVQSRGGICPVILWVEGEGGSPLPLLLAAYFKPGQAEPASGLYWHLNRRWWFPTCGWIRNKEAVGSLFPFFASAKASRQAFLLLNLWSLEARWTWNWTNNFKMKHRIAFFFFFLSPKAGPLFPKEEDSLNAVPLAK